MADKIKIEYIDIGLLRPAEYNPRKWNEAQVGNLRASIEKYGIIDPLIVNNAPERANVLIGGHFRLYVAGQMGIKQVPVVYLTITDIEREKELNVRLNKNMGEFDLELLADFDESLLKDIGFSSEEMDKIFKAEDKPEDDDVPEVKTTDRKSVV